MLILSYTVEKNNDYEIIMTFEHGIIGLDYLSKVDTKQYLFHIYGRRAQKPGQAVWVHPALLHATYFEAQRYQMVDFPTPLQHHRLYSIDIRRIGGTAQVNLRLESIQVFIVPAGEWEEYFDNFMATEADASGTAGP